jgi:hypothetical protein
MYDTIFVNRWGPTIGSSTRLILPPRFERPAPATGASSDVDAVTGFEELSPVELIAGGAREPLSGAAVPA